MKKINLVTTVAVLGMLTFGSCQKETMEVHEESSLQSYPDEITLDNWEQFVYAPQSVIDYHAKKNARNKKGNSIKQTTSPTVSRGFVVGSVLAFDGSWRGIENVQATLGGVNTTTNAGGYYYFANNSSGSLCMDYSTSLTNGVNTFDMLLIQRHIVNIKPFTEAREFIAANVDANSVIDTNDVNLLRQLILGAIQNLPSGNNILFIPESEYVLAQNSINNGGVLFLNFLDYYSTRPLCIPNEIDRRSIKMGDVDGSFIF